MNPDLRASLAMVAEAAAQARESWWIIGSAAVALHGADAGLVHDIDLLMSTGDARDVLRSVGGEPRKGEPSTQFRSDVFGTWDAPPVSVEIFGGFSVSIGGLWTPVNPSTREAVLVDGAAMFVPAIDELIHLLHSFGRPKDLARANALEQLR